jgi:hypothetical protein
MKITLKELKHKLCSLVGAHNQNKNEAHEESSYSREHLEELKNQNLKPIKGRMFSRGTQHYDVDPITKTITPLIDSEKTIARMDTGYSHEMRNKFTDDAAQKHHELVGGHTTYIDSLSPADKEHLNNFTQLKGESKNLNTYLYNTSEARRGGEPVNPEGGLEKKAQDLSNVIKGAPKLKKDTTVYTMVSRSNDIGDAAKNGRELHFPAFLSTAIHPQGALNFAERRIKESEHGADHFADLLRIHLPKDTAHGLYIEPVSRFKNEQEYLLDRDKHIQVHGESKIHFENGIKVRVFDAHIVDKPVNPHRFQPKANSQFDTIDKEKVKVNGNDDYKKLYDDSGIMPIGKNDVYITSAVKGVLGSVPSQIESFKYHTAKILRNPSTRDSKNAHGYIDGVLSDQEYGANESPKITGDVESALRNHLIKHFKGGIGGSVNESTKKPLNSVQVFGLHDEFENLHKEHGLTLSDGEKKVILDYTSSSYIPINVFLHNPLRVSEPEIQQKRSDNISNAIKKFPKLHKDVTVYTAVSKRNDIEELRKKSNILHLPAFTSTSIGHEVAVGSHAIMKSKDIDDDKHSDHIVTHTADVLRIHLPEGSRHGAFIASSSIAGPQRYIIIMMPVVLAIGLGYMMHTLPPMMN